MQASSLLEAAGAAVLSPRFEFDQICLSLLGNAAAIAPVPPGTSNGPPTAVRQNAKAIVRCTSSSGVEAIGKNVIAKHMGAEDAALRRLQLRAKQVPSNNLTL